MDTNNIYEGTLKYKLIYIFAINDSEHDGYLKIGEHSFDSASSYRMLPPNCEELNQAAHTRIRGYTQTALTRYELLHTELARKTVRLADGTIESTPQVSALPLLRSEVETVTSLPHLHLHNHKSCPLLSRPDS